LKNENEDFSNGSSAGSRYCINEIFSNDADYLIISDSIGWNVEMDTFTEENTVVGPKKFTNVIANLDPEAEGRLVLACHIDSMASIGKLFICPEI
jgi:hypothetical protein